MIYTVTFNPSLDYIIGMEEFTPGMVNRTSSEQMLPGGKGINVSIVLKNLGMDTVALGFIAGFTGKEIEKRVRETGCTTDFIELAQGQSRINVKLNVTKETEINGQGPDISENDIEKLYRKLDLLNKEDILVLAGSIPNTMPDTIYEDILEQLQKTGCRIVVDATGELLVRVLKYRPFLIKPNNHELGEIFGVTLSSIEDIVTYAAKIQEMGARNVLVSMAGDGAVFLSEDGTIYQTPAPKGKLVNSVGAGDSMVAGFLTGYLESGSYENAFYMGVATGSASAFSTQLATRPEVIHILEALRG